MNTAGFGKYVLNTVVTMIAGRTLNVVRDELDEAKHEIQEKAKNVGAGIGIIAGALTVLFFMVGVLLSAAVLGLATVWPAWLAALVVSGALLVIFLILLGVGTSKIKKNKDLRPERAISNLRKHFGS